MTKANNYLLYKSRGYYTLKDLAAIYHTCKKFGSVLTYVKDSYYGLMLTKILYQPIGSKENFTVQKQCNEKVQEICENHEVGKIFHENQFSRDVVTNFMIFFERETY